jgi:Na+-driven multidrug efflux pump
MLAKYLGYTEISDPILNKSTPLLSRTETMKKSFAKISTTAGSFTLLLSYLALQIIASYLEKEGENDIRAAMSLIIAYMNFLATNSFILFSMSPKLSEAFGKLRDEELLGGDILLLYNDAGIPGKYANSENIILCKQAKDLIHSHDVFFTLRDKSKYPAYFAEGNALDKLCTQLGITFPEKGETSLPLKKSPKYKTLYEYLISSTNVKGFQPNSENLSVLRNEIVKITQNGIKLTLPAMLLTAVPMYFSGSILTALKQSEETALLAQTYLRANAPGAALLVVRIALEQVLYGDNRFTQVMFNMWAAFIIGTAAAAYLALGKPQLGLAGIAYGYNFNAVLDCVLLVSVLIRDPTYKEISFFRGWALNQEDWEQMKALFSLGVSIAFQSVSEFASLFVMSIFAGHLGKEALAIQGYAMMLWFFALIIIFAAGTTLSNIIGFLRGEGKYLDANRYATWGTLTTLLITLGLTLPCAIYPGLLTYLTGKTNTEILLKLEYVIRIVAITLVLDSIRNPLGTILRANGDEKWPTVMTSVPLWLGVLAGWLLETKTELGILGGVIGYGTGILAGLFPILWRSVTKLDPQSLRAFTEKNKVRVISATSSTAVEVPADSANSVNAPAESGLWERCKACFFETQSGRPVGMLDDNRSLATLDRDNTRGLTHTR